VRKGFGEFQELPHQRSEARVCAISAFSLNLEAKRGCVGGQHEIHTQNKFQKNRLANMIPIGCQQIESKDLDKPCDTKERKRARSYARHSSATPEAGDFNSKIEQLQSDEQFNAMQIAC
jgi:hypothetical protein